MNKLNEAFEKITEIKGNGFIIVKKGTSLQRELIKLIIEEKKERGKEMKKREKK